MKQRSRPSTPYPDGNPATPFGRGGPDASRVAVVGAGLGGLSAAIRLAAAGYQVDVYEKQSGPGGKAFTEQIGEYRFDTGPSLFTLKPVFERLFQEAGRRLEDYISLTPLPTICNYFWRDGTRTTAYQDREAMKR